MSTDPMEHIGQENKGQQSFFVQKAEKLATAMYMITDIIDSREPIRWKAREEAMEVLSLIGGSGLNKSYQSNTLHEITQAINRSIHILTLARNAKLISEMNALVVMKEYSELKDKITHNWSGLHEQPLLRLNQQFFKTESVPPTSPHRISFPQQEIKRTLPGTQQFSSQEQSVSYAHRTQSEQSVKDNQSDKISSKNSSGERKQVILNLLKTKTEVSVSDVLKELPNVSDKTVQRELVGMVESGVLQKKGEKRWSTYSLKPLP
jgi:hypothetical protein